MIVRQQAFMDDFQANKHAAFFEAAKVTMLLEHRLICPA